MAQELLGAPTIDGGSARAGGGESKKSNKPSKPPGMECCQNGRFPALFALKIAKNAAFDLKVLNKIYS